MPSPIAHGAVGYAVGTLLFPSLRGAAGGGRRRLPRVVIAAAALALLPDLGSAVGVVTGEFARYHNSWEHSLLVGLLVAAAGAGLVAWRQRRHVGRWFVLVLLCFQSHVLMDFLTWGRGVELFWPVSQARFRPPFYLFYGLHWSDGWLSSRHWVTLGTELVFVGLVVLLLRLRRGGREEEAPFLTNDDLSRRVGAAREMDR